MIKHIVLASHGTLAEGLYRAAKIILGEDQLERVEYLNCYVDETQNVADDVKKIAEHCDDNTVIFTDLFGGSVNNQFYVYLQEKGYLLISGINLPLLIDVLLFQGNCSDLKQYLSEKTGEYIQIQSVNHTQEDEDF